MNKTNSAKIRCNKEQARVYNELHCALESIVPVLEKFDGKVINVRLEKAMNEVLPGGKNGISARLKNSYSEKKRIELFNRNRCIQHEGSVYYVTIDTCYIDISPGRLNKSEAITAVNEEQSNLRKSANELLNSCNDVENAEMEYKNICKIIKDFNNKYHYSIRENLRFNNVY